MAKEKEAPNTPIDQSKRIPQKKLFIFIGLSMVLIALLASSVYFFIQYQNTQKLLKDPAQADKGDVKMLIAKVGMIMALPDDEVPTIATVSDKSKLRDQVFFLRAENGDKVLIYSNAKRAILYRPSSNKIIDVTSVAITSPETGGTPSASLSGASQTIVSPTVQAAKAVRVALYNGTKVNGLTKQVEEKLKTLSSLASHVVVKTNATGDYADSVVVDLTGKNDAAATQLAAFAKGKVTSLPAGETKPAEVDILIILGTSYVGNVTPTPTP